MLIGLRKENKGMTSSNMQNEQVSPHIRCSSCSPYGSRRVGDRAESSRRMEQQNTFTQRWLGLTKPVDLGSATSGTTFSMDSGSRAASRCQSTRLVLDTPSKTINSPQPRPPPGEKNLKNFTNIANKRTGVKEKLSSFGRTRSPSLPKCCAVKEKNTPYVRPRSPSLTKCSAVNEKNTTFSRPRSPSLTNCNTVKEKNSAFVRPRSPSLTKCSAVKGKITTFGRTRSPSLTKSVKPSNASAGNKLQTSPCSSMSPSTKIPTSKNIFTARPIKSNASEKKLQPPSSPSSASPSTKIPSPKHAFSARQASIVPPPISPNRGRPLATTVAPALVHNVIKSFKPQLEDIKSSIFLMNNRPGEKSVTHQNCAHGSNQPGNLPISKSIKSNPIDENSRKQQLEEARKKIQSKEYWYKSKYEKIEGLNWISWR